MGHHLAICHEMFMYGKGCKTRIVYKESMLSSVASYKNEMECYNLL